MTWTLRPDRARSILGLSSAVPPPTMKDWGGIYVHCAEFWDQSGSELQLHQWLD